MKLLKPVSISLVACLVLCAAVLGACGRRGAVAPEKPATPVPATTPAPAATAPAPAVSSEAKLGLHTTTAKGEKKFIVVLTDFPDVQRKYPESQIKDRTTGFVPSYYREASYNQMWLKAESTKRYVLPNPVSYYKISSRNLEVDPTKVLALVTDMANAADDDVKFTEDMYIMIALGATHVEYGMVGLCAIPGMLGFQTTSITNKSGETIKNAAIFCENAHLGTYVHDSLHMIGGRIEKQRLTPCLYDHELQAKYTGIADWPKCLVNMGFWDPLSSHAPYKLELPPTGVSSWTKMRLGWIDPAKIAMVNPGQDTTVRLDPLADANSSTLVVKIPLTATTYYLLENRQKIGSDANCPSSGVLILYADDAVYECRQGKAPVKIMDANPSIPYLNDAAYDIGKNEVYVDKANNLAIVLLKKMGQSYEIRITTPDKAKAASR